MIAETEWAAVAADLTACARRLAARNDLIVVCVGNETQREHGLFHRDTAKITINIDRLLPGVHPGDVHFGSPAFRAQHPHIMGILLHEVGHADHTPRRGTQHAAISHWMTVLEEPRVEYSMLHTHPSARRWLQAAARLTVPTWMQQTREAAAEAAVLFGGRVAAGILSRSDVAALLGYVESILGADCQRILTIVESTLALADDDVDAIRDAAMAIEGMVAFDGDTEPRDAGRTGGIDFSPSVDPVGPARMSRIGDEQGYAAEAVDLAVDFGWRAPSSAEAAQVAAIASWRYGESIPARHTVIVAAASPPGRLRTAALVERAGQRAAGQPVTAEPFQRRRRKMLPASRIEAGIIVDCSGSMQDYLDVVGGAAWVLTHAFGGGDLARTRTWTFDETVRVLPTATSQVAVPKVGGATTMLPAALDTYQAWSRAGDDAKVLVVVSDGRMRDNGIRLRLQQIAAAGTRVVWMFPNREATMLAGAPIGAGIHPISLADNVTQLPFVVSSAVMSVKTCSAN